MNKSAPQMSKARHYQLLRAHLSYLKLGDAAEALPHILDAARAENLSVTAALKRLLEIEVNATEARHRAPEVDSLSGERIIWFRMEPADGRHGGRLKPAYPTKFDNAARRMPNLGEAKQPNKGPRTASPKDAAAHDFTGAEPTNRATKCPGTGPCSASRSRTLRRERHSRRAR